MTTRFRNSVRGLVAVVTVAVGLSASAGMRCDQSVISRGFLTFEVEERCGPPVTAFSRVDYGRYGEPPVYVDEWVYELGSNKFRRLLRFEDGRLRRIETLRKPYRSSP